MKSAVIVFPAANCDRDAQTALTQMTGKAPHMVWHQDSELPDVDLVVLPGGFSYGDYLRCGAMANQSSIMGAIKAHADRGGAVLGICNGFQVLTEAGLLPGALMRNAGLKFLCKPVALTVEETQSSFTRKYDKGQEISIPIAHGEGNYYADEDTLDRLEDVLADYDGVLLLVSHDRDFIDRLATSTIALDGRGHIVETPGGWKDFLEQNPDFLEAAGGASRRKMSSTSAPAAPAAQSPSKPAKLSYKDQRRLEELEQLIESLPGKIGGFEKELADPALYSRDPKRFDALMKSISAAQAQLADAEHEWLTLEERRSELAGG